MYLKKFWQDYSVILQVFQSCCENIVFLLKSRLKNIMFYRLTPLIFIQIMVILITSTERSSINVKAKN